MTDRPILRAIAGIEGGRDITRGWVRPNQLLWQTDEIAARGALGDEVYKPVRDYWKVYTCLQQRQLSVISRAWRVTPGGSGARDIAAADSLRAQLAALEWDAITRDMLWGVFYGFAVAEALYRRDGREIVLDDIRVRDRVRFGYDGARRLRLRTMGDIYPGEIMPPRKFWQFAVGADNGDEPYGVGLAHWCYWPVWLAKNGLRFWSIFLDRFGSPTPIGEFPLGTTEEDKRALLQATQAIYTDSGIIIPEGMKLTLIEASRGGTARYDAFVDHLEDAMAQVILGQTASTRGTAGRLGSDDLQADVRDDIVKADADVVCGSFSRQVGRWLTDWNYPGAATPQVRRSFDEPDELGEVAMRMQSLGAIGFLPTLAHVQSVFGGEWTDARAAGDATGAPGAGKPPAFAEPPKPDAVEGQVDRLEATIGPVMDRLMEPVRRLVLSAQSLDEIRGGLARLYPRMEMAAFSEVLAEALIAANLLGRAEVAGGH